MRIGIATLFVLELAGCSLYFDDGGPAAPPTEPSDTPPADQGRAPSSLAAACNAPDGAALRVAPSNLAAHLAGRWWLCGGAAEFYGNVEFTADMHFYMLTQVNGQFVRNLGPRTNGSYSINQGPEGISFSIQQLYQDGSGATYPLQGYIEQAPRKLLLGGGYYVAIP